MKYKVAQARVVYDLFDVEAETPRDAASLVANGKIAESEFASTEIAHRIHDHEGTIKVLDGKLLIQAFDRSLLLLGAE